MQSAVLPFLCKTVCPLLRLRWLSYAVRARVARYSEPILSAGERAIEQSTEIYVGIDVFEGA